jgi:hypothetical protein
VDGMTAGTIAAVLVPVVTWVDYRLRAVERRVASLDAKMDMLMVGKRVVNDASDSKTDVGAAPRPGRR